MLKLVAGIAACTLILGVVSNGVLAQEPAAPPTGSLSLPGGDSNFDPNQPIKPGFDLNVAVSSSAGIEADLTGAFKVDAAGIITMKIIGPVTVRDLTPTQAADTIAGKVKSLIKDPKVTVSIVGVPKPAILLSGGVLKPGANAINNGSTLAEVLTVFGFTENADLSRVRVIRKDAGKTIVKEYDLVKWLKPMPGVVPADSQNPALLDKDFVFVPLKNLPASGRVSVSGAVTKAGEVPLRYGVPTTVREALSLAGGLLPTADRSRVALRRVGHAEVMMIDFDRAEAGDATQDITLQADDILYVETLSIEKFVNMNGAFIRPGKLPYLKPVTLTQAISEASGLAITAKANQGRVYRHLVTGDPTKTQVIAFNYDRIRKNKEPDIRLEPGDTVEVPIGNAPRAPLTGLELAQSLLSIALIVDRIFSGSKSGSGF